MRLLVLTGSPLARWGISPDTQQPQETQSSSERAAGRMDEWWMDGESYLKVGRGVAPRACPLRRHARRGALLLLGAVQDHEEILCSSPAGDQAS